MDSNESHSKMHVSRVAGSRLGRSVLSFVLTAAVVAASYIFGGGAGLLMAAFVLVECYFLAPAKAPGMVGIETLTITAIIGGFTFGSVLGAFFSALVVPFIVGLKMVSKKRAHYVSIPFAPSVRNLIDGVVAFVAGSMMHLPFMLVVIVALVARRAMMAIYINITTLPEEKMGLVALITNLIFNIFLAYVAGKVLGLF